MTLTPPSKPLTFNQALIASGIDLSRTLVMRHRPTEPALNKIFDNLISERPELFNSYQSTHAPKAESALTKSDYLASFVRYQPKTALFVGLYGIVGSRIISLQDQINDPEHLELIRFGMSGTVAAADRSHVIKFQLDLLDWHQEWRGRLVVQWPGLERSWYRWADRNEFAIESISEEGLFNRKIPAWEQLVLDWKALRILPASWHSVLRQWRGIYLITDASDGKMYVGSAYGAENILQRWLEYSRTGHGGNRLLRLRDPEHFRFSILQRVSPDLDGADVVAIEDSWKARLGTRSPNGLNDN